MTMSGKKGANFHGNKHVGKQYNRWTVVEVFRENNRTFGICKCECGQQQKVNLYTVTSGTSKSCGCLMMEVCSVVNKTHGYAKSKTYRSWNSMKERCLNKNSAEYPNWGGRGITICERWVNSFENFLEDMGQCPPGYTLDRIDCNGPYEKANCRWATHTVQNRNRRHCWMAKVGDKVMPLGDAAEMFGLVPNNFKYEMLTHKRKVINGIEITLAGRHG